MLEILPDLTIQNILSRVSEMDIFRYYCNNLKKPGENFHSPFRKDKEPSARIDNYKGKLIFKDFGEGSKTAVDCFGFVQRKHCNCTFQEALNIINQDFNLRLQGEKLSKENINPPIINNEQYDKIYTGRSNIRVHYKDWDGLSISYMQDHKLDYKHVSNKFKVNPIDYFWLNKYQYKAEELSFASYFGIKEDKYIYKIYQPLVKKHKWYHNLTEEIIQGYLQLPQSGDLLIITKAFKDVWAYDSHNIVAIAPGAEGWDIPENIIKDLKERFKIIYINYDFDYSGLKGLNKLKRKYNLKPLILTNGRFKTINYGYKDFADYCKANTFEYVQEQINIILNERK